VHVLPTPRLGGVAMFGGLLAGLLVAENLPLLRSVFEDSQDPEALLSGAVLVCLLGVADDRWALDALTKLAGQVAAAGVMVLQGIQLLWLPLPDGPFVLPPSLGVPLTVLVVVVTINAVNFVDGLDGLAAGIVAIAAAAFFLFSYLLWVKEGVERAATPTLITAVLVGMCAGFIPHNFHPARVFMGDSGSMLIGLLLAASTITLTGQLDPNALTELDLVVPALLPLLLPLLVLLVPIADLLLAVVRRTRAGRSPFAADKQHLHHRLLEIGHSHRRAVLVMYVWSGLVAFGALVVATVPGRGPRIGVVAVLLLALGVTLNLDQRRAARRAAARDARTAAGASGAPPRPPPLRRVPLPRVQDSVGGDRRRHADAARRRRRRCPAATWVAGVSLAAEREVLRACEPVLSPRQRVSPHRGSGATTRAYAVRPVKYTPGSPDPTPRSAVCRCTGRRSPGSRTCRGPTRCRSPADRPTRSEPCAGGVRRRPDGTGSAVGASQPPSLIGISACVGLCDNFHKPPPPDPIGRACRGTTPSCCARQHPRSPR
jgi:UDP-GlcNAc:undecaprenyl-phosphate GlcNAc-1-phosphate transferase